ncbi:MAG TPA: cyclopropane-fatty-acyl-phospholipid synthase family protein [Nocardioidaceae bacterium]|nr:cyclopropane-fatty-acyl-phospholipid synthase family protein [Nocardioidaceae bacterium]
MSRTMHDARTSDRHGEEPLTLAEILQTLSAGPVQFRFTAYDGSSAGPADARVGFHLHNARGAAYLATAPGSLGMARAYVTGDLEVTGVHPGDPYDALRVLADSLRWKRAQPRELRRITTSLGVRNLLPPPPPPPQEAAPDWRRMLSGRRHSKVRDSSAISHHYDVSNHFYELVLGPSMTYTCSCYPHEAATLEEAQAHKYELVCRKLALRPGQRLLDVGCGWGGMVMHAAREHGVRALGVTLSQQQASWAQAEIKRRGLDDLAEVRHLDYREVHETGFDAVSSIGLTEHIGVRNYPAYFTFLRNHLRPGGRLLNHCITRPENRTPSRARGGFIDSYVFPDGELTGSGTIITAMQDVGFEVRHEENLREHYARTCAAWCANLVEHWDECVAEVGAPTAKVWGLYLAGSRLGFERNQVQLHQVLGVRLHDDGRADFPLRPDWE